MANTNGSKLTEKLHALNMMSKMLGLMEVGPVPRSPEVIEKINSKITDDVVGCCLIRIVDRDVHPISRAACAQIISLRHPNWRDHVPSSVLGFIVDRGSPEVRRWRRAVLDRDKHKCTVCGAEDELHAHHIVRWSDAPELRVEVTNGQTLCQSCHVEAHRVG